MDNRVHGPTHVGGKKFSLSLLLHSAVNSPLFLFTSIPKVIGTQVTSGGAGGGGVIMMEEEGYWGSPCSSSESHPELNRDRYSPSTVINGASGNGSIAVGTVRNLSSHHHQLPDQSSLSTSSLSSASSTSSSVSASSSPYGGAGHTHPTGGYHHSHRHQSHEQHHHQQIPSSMYCSSIVYEKSNAGR